MVNGKLAAKGQQTLPNLPIDVLKHFLITFSGNQTFNRCHPAGVFVFNVGSVDAVWRPGSYRLLRPSSGFPIFQLLTGKHFPNLLSFQTFSRASPHHRSRSSSRAWMTRLVSSSSSSSCPYLGQIFNPINFFSILKLFLLFRSGRAVYTACCRTRRSTKWRSTCSS